MDRDGGVRASMVETACTCILDYVGPQLSSPGILLAARLHHDGHGVPEDLFVFCSILGADWSPDVEASWRWLLDELAAIR